MPVRYRRAGRTVWRHVHGLVLVRPMSAPAIIALTGTGVDLWRLLATPLTVDELARELGDRYTRPEDDIRLDIAPALKDLLARGVLEQVDQP